MSISQPLIPSVTEQTIRRTIHRTSRGFTLIELIVVISIIAITATVALDRLFWYQGQAEKSSMEYTASMIKSGLWMSAASLMMADHSAEVASLAQQNPINLLAQKPENYLGELNGDKVNALKAGHWFYDISKKQVVYIVNHRRNFTPAATEDYAIRYGTKVLYGEMEIAQGNKVKYVTGVTLVPLSQYVWQ